MNYKYFARDLSWLSFNYRVLEEANDKDLPLYERIKFFAIFSSNLDEFYKVRVASIRSLMSLYSKLKKTSSNDPEQLLRQINEEVSSQLNDFRKIFSFGILPELEQNNIILHLDDELDDDQMDFIQRYFYLEVLPNIQPALLAKGRILSFLQDNAIYMAVKLFIKTNRNAKKRKENEGEEEKKKNAQYAIIKIPTHYLPRFVKLPSSEGKYHIIFLDDIIRYNLQVLFPGYNIDSAFTIKLTRDADLMIEDEFHGDLVEKIRRSLTRRKTGRPSRFLFDSRIPNSFLRILKQVFNLSEDDMVSGPRYHHLQDFFSFPNPLAPNLEIEPIKHLRHSQLDKFDSMFDAIKEKDWLLHYPYQSYDYVINFFNQAAVDPKVEVIKTTQYRVANNSAIVSALISAARNGKDVTVFVEFKARFDEEMNLNFAEKMQKAGIKIIHSIPGIKVHAKAALVLRRSTREKKQRGYAYLSTGNFNEKTAKLYSDIGLFTSKDVLIDELKDFFLYLENTASKYLFRNLLVAPNYMRAEIRKKIDREIENVEAGRKGYILMKLNSLEEKKTIDKLYEASEKGVKIDLIIRGICCLIPGKRFSSNIRVIRIVDRFLEHARIWYFENNGQQEMYMSSADIMQRNLYRRIEIAVPILDQEIRQEIYDFLILQMADNTKARLIDSHMNNIPIPRDEDTPIIRAQYDFYEYLKRKMAN